MFNAGPGHLPACDKGAKENGGQVWAACRLGETRDSTLWFRLKANRPGLNWK
jgi:hypothetical protein